MLRLLALCCRNLGEQGMAEHYLARIPELYFTKTELAAAILKDGEQLEAIRKTEVMSLGTLTAMLILDGEAAGDAGKRALAERLLDLFRSDAAFSDVCERLKQKLDEGTILDFYR